MNKWTKEELRLALALYCQMPFGKMHSRNPEIIRLAQQIGRTPSAVAMKLVNFASLDPQITNSGRVGLGNASALDREVWGEFQKDWEGQLVEASKVIEPEVFELPSQDMETMRRSEVEIRTKQSVFRKMVLSSYVGRCCITGLSDPRLLVASHIVPWNEDKKNRLNPQNGLCLNVLHDKAFDRGLITVTPELTISVSPELKKLRDDPFAANNLVSMDGAKIRLPEKFAPSPEFLAWHGEHVFLGVLNSRG
uniref:Putative restriction endonuclease n=1 Tax=mine drainage metagenome TaxID=410659 RepID=E6QTZ9_9ZZZZ